MIILLYLLLIAAINFILLNIEARLDAYNTKHGIEDKHAADIYIFGSILLILHLSLAYWLWHSWIVVIPSVAMYAAQRYWLFNRMYNRHAGFHPLHLSTRVWWDRQQLAYPILRNPMSKMIAVAVTTFFTMHYLLLVYPEKEHSFGVTMFILMGAIVLALFAMDTLITPEKKTKLVGTVRKEISNRIEVLDEGIYDLSKAARRELNESIDNLKRISDESKRNLKDLIARIKGNDNE